MSKIDSTLTHSEQKFFEVMRVALGHQSRLSSPMTREEWLAVAEISQKQYVMGVLLDGANLLPPDQRPPFDVRLIILSKVAEIEDRNRFMNPKCVEICQHFTEAGFKSIILKGQGVATLYDQPLHRLSGDIDIWVSGTKEEILAHVRKYKEPKEVEYHHVDFNILDNVEIEVHFFPTYSFNPVANWRVMRWIRTLKMEDVTRMTQLPEGAGSIPMPTHEFNAVHILQHALRHFIYGGIGLRHILDHYYVLKALHAEHPNDFDTVKAQIAKTYKQLGITTFAQAMMWIFKEFLGMDDSWLLVEPSEEHGVFLLKELMQMGNFGWEDKRNESELTTENHFDRTRLKIANSLRFFHSFPGESIGRMYVLTKEFVFSHLGLSKLGKNVE